MTDTIDRLAAAPETLRKVTLAGPLVEADGKRWPMWVLSAAAPSFDYHYAFDEKGRPSGVTADHAHPLRVLAAEQPGPAPRRWMQPSLMSVHLVLGADNFQYHQRPEQDGGPDKDRLLLGWTAGKEDEVLADYGRILRTRTEGVDASGGLAPFVQVSAQPLPAGLPDGDTKKLPGDWMEEHAADGVIPLPPLRLVSGRIGMRARLSKSPGLAWLSRLGIAGAAEAGDDWQTWPSVWLVPDGIEFDARLPFPGRSGAPALAGRVLLHPDPARPGKFRLTLIEAADPQAWLAAWYAIVPRGGDATESLLGLKFAARRDGSLPGFSWQLEAGAHGPAALAPATVWVSARDCELLLTGPRAGGATDSVAALRLAELKIRDRKDKDEHGKDQDYVEFEALAGPQTGAIACKYLCTPERAALSVSDGADARKPVSLDIDAARLAEELRAAYGLPTPPAVPARRAPGLAYGAAYARPLLPAFVPLDEGWLQLPVPNLGPLDTSSDLVLAGGGGTVPASVLNGFLRLRHNGLGEAVQSGYHPDRLPARGQGAPWSLTVERAAGAQARVRLLPRGDGDAARLVEAELVLSGAVLSARGLLWLSADRPDADEALPRFGAGPNSFFDTLMESADASASDPSPLCATVDSLGASVTRDAKAPATLDWARMSIGFRTGSGRWVGELLKPAEARRALSDAGACIRTGFPLPAATLKTAAPARLAPWPAVAWLRHPVLPLATAMPMTRAAAGGPRPLESRELFPLALLGKDGLSPPPPLLALASLARRAGSPLPHLDEDSAFTLTPTVAWPLGRDTAPAPERGIAMASVGVPGVELRVLAAPKAGAQPAYEAALRYDLPLLDEAFATATLPPPPGAPQQQQQEQQPALDSVATALDWPLLAALWARQERKHQNARVVDSYVCDYRAVNQKPASADILSLVRGLVWTADVAFTTGSAAASGALSYGSVSLGGWTASGNDALAGYTGTVKPARATPPPAGALLPVPAGLELLGFSPATFQVDQLDLDNSMSGASALLRQSGRLIERELAVGGVKGSRLVSMADTDAVVIGGQDFRFWFKDMLFKGDTAVLDAWDSDTGFEIADKDALLAAAGGEWRFAPNEERAAEAALRLGRGELLLCGLRLEPLRLTGLTVAGNALAGASLVCRLSLDPRGDGPNFVLLTLSRKQPADALEAEIALLDPGAPLVFNATVAEPQAGAGLIQRRVRVRATPTLVQGKPGFKDAVFDIEVAGRMVRLAGASIRLPAAQDALQLVRVVQSGVAPEPAAGDARLRIEAAEFSAGYALEDIDGRPTLREIAPALSWKRHVEIFAGEALAAKPALCWTLGGTAAQADVAVFGVELGSFEAAADEGKGALSLTINDQALELPSGLKATLGGALLARIGQDSGKGAAALASGCCELTLIQDGDSTGKAPALGPNGAFSGGKAELSASADAAGRWSGAAVLSATIDATSDIRWPALLPAGHADAIPLPARNAKNNNGRVRVLPGAGEPAVHEVSWTLAGHRLPLDLAGALLTKDSARAWVTPVAAHHRLVRGQREIAWSGIESLAIGRTAAIVPRLPNPLTDDAKTFATRYASAIAGGRYGDDPEAGMLDPGIGAVATVLQGTLGSAFRTQFWSTAPKDRLLFAGGFLGQLATGGEAAPLLRLPVLAGTGLSIEQTGAGADGIELAWHDGPAARLLARTRPSAPAPANASFEALGAALLAGSLTAASDPDGAVEMAGALLVEQSYAAPSSTQETSLQRRPFFLAAAVSVSAMLDALAEGKHQAASLSLVGGSLRRGGRSHALAASVAMQPALPALPGSARRDSLFVLGQGIKEHPWNRGLPGGDGSTLVPYLRRLAPGYDPDPAGFLFAQRPGDALPRYLAGAIVPPGLEGLAVPGGAPNVFGDGRRGPGTAPVPQDLLRLAPPREGAAAPVRDAKPSNRGWKGSGIAGLARRMALPAQAGRAWMPTDLAAAPGLVWLSSTQTPVYLPLRIAGLRGAPVAWLQQAAPQVRLPTGEEVNRTLGASHPPDPAGAQGDFTLQGFLPAALGHAAVGERAGVMTLRRSRLLARLDGKAAAVAAFDAAYARFGAPGQAGSSWARKLRTPRPGPLPPNVGDAARDRRVQASFVRPLEAGSATIGSADIVQGGPGRFGTEAFSAWSIEVAAMPESASMVSERWDSALRLVCRIEVRKDGADAFTLGITPGDFLASALFGTAGNTTAVLKVGDTVIPYRWMEMLKVEGAGVWVYAGVSLPDDERQPPPVVWRTASATVVLVFDARATPQQGTAAFAPFGKALEAAGAQPAVELQWTVLPRAGGAARAIGAVPLELKPLTTPYPTLVAGSRERPSLTLRLPLYPVRQSRGALPLTPATLVFSDPAYDRELAGVPAAARTRLEATAAAGLDGRGELRMALYADRGSVNRRGVLTLMVDIAYERRLDEAAQAIADAAGALPGGDLFRKDGPAPLARIGLQLVPADGPARPLRYGQTAPASGPLVEAGTVYELPLALLTEMSGEPARLRAGDVLQVDAALGFKEDATSLPAVTVSLWHNGHRQAEPASIAMPANGAPHSLLNIVLTDEAVAAPPAALYLALQRSGAEGATQLSVPLHAQSPLPRRLDLMDAARGFRQGLLRRHADFVWYLSSTDARLGERALAPVKSDRNGQAYFPASAADFLTPRRQP